MFVRHDAFVGTTPTVAQLVGLNVRRRRHRDSLQRPQRQDELASLLRERFGLRWTQATVAAVESGRRQVRLDELPCVCAALSCTPADLFEGSGRVRLADGAEGDLEDVRKILSGDRSAKLGGLGYRPDRSGMAALKELLAQQRRLAPRMRISELERADLAAQGDAERKAARKLGVEPLTVAVAAFGAWSRSLTEERDERVAERAEDADPRSVQAMRGQVTRQLVVELRQRIQEGLDG